MLKHRNVLARLRRAEYHTTQEFNLKTCKNEYIPQTMMMESKTTITWKQYCTSFLKSDICTTIQRNVLETERKREK